MKKKFIFIFLMTLMVFILVACGDSPKKIPTVPDEWVDIDVSPLEMYKGLVNGGCSLLSDFSEDNFKKNKNLFVNGEVEVELNGAKLWCSVDANYVDDDRQNAMLSFMLSSEKGSYENMEFGVFLYKEVAYIAVGETKFKFALNEKVWSDFFPLKKLNIDQKKKNEIASYLVTATAIKDNQIKAKQRVLENNSVENIFSLEIDLNGTLTKIDKLLAGQTQINQSLVERLYSIIWNVLGVSKEDIGNGRIPKSNINLSFSLAEGKLTSFISHFVIDQSNNNNSSIFGSESVDLQINFLKLNTSKTNRVPIDFVNCASKQAEYKDYLHEIFQLKFDLMKYNADGKGRNYELVSTAKVYQTNPLDNYLSFEYYLKTEKGGKVLETGLYAYQGNVYYYLDGENGYECVVKAPLIIGNLTQQLFENNLMGDPNLEAKFDIWSCISNVIGSIRWNKDNLRFNLGEKFYSDVWYNFDNMLINLDNRYVEDLYAYREVSDLVNFIKKQACVATFDWDEPFMFIVGETALDDTFTMLSNAIPKNQLTSVPK